MERRREPRVRVPARVDLRFDSFSKFVSQYVENVSRSGMFIVTPRAYPVGTMLEFRLALEDEFPLIEGKAQVVWVRRGGGPEDRPSGMAVRFLHVEEEGRRLIERMVRQQLESAGEVFDLHRADGAVVVAPGAGGGDPFEVKSPVRREGGNGAFDVFPAPPDDGREEMPSGGKAFTVTPVEEDPKHRRDERSLAGLLVAAVLLVVLGLAAYVHMSSRDGEAGPGSTVARAAAAGAGELPPTAPSGERPGRTARPEAEPSPSPVAPVGSPGGAVAVVQEMPSPAAQEAGAAVEPSPVAAPAVSPRPATAPAVGDAEVPGVVARGVTVARPVRGTATVAARARRAARLLTVRAEKESGGTRVVLGFDGSVRTIRARAFSMERPPRFVLQLSRIGAPDPYAVIPAGSPEVHRVRLGYHRGGRAPYLQVVLDLTADGLAVRRERSGDRIVVHVSRSGR